MASVRITINTDGAAFHSEVADPPLLNYEVARILRDDVCTQLLRKDIEDIGPLHDVDGNPCGTVEVIE